MTVVLIASTQDPASLNIKQCLLEHSSWGEHGTFATHTVYEHAEMDEILLVTITDRKITHEHLDMELHQRLNIIPKQLIFLSRHRSKMGQPTLTVHPIGNYGTAEFGGKSKTLIPSAPRLMTHLLRLIKHHKESTDLEHQVCYEVTHHGPYLETPTLFVEIGSTEQEWNKKTPGVIIAQSLLDLLQDYRYETDLSDDIPVLIGIGGGHYAPRFTKVIFEKNAAFGHMIPSYHIEAGNMTQEMIEKAMNATPKASGIYISRKAFKKSEVSEYRQWFETMGIPVLSSKELPPLS